MEKQRAHKAVSAEVANGKETKSSLLSTLETSCGVRDGKVTVLSAPALPLNEPRVDFQVYCDVEPKRQALAQTNLDLAAATEKLEAIRKKLVVSVI